VLGIMPLRLTAERQLLLDRGCPGLQCDNLVLQRLNQVLHFLKLLLQLLKRMIGHPWPSVVLSRP
jgi:hypothetical protein